MKHKSGHIISTKDFSNKLTSHLNSPSYLALKTRWSSLTHSYIPLGNEYKELPSQFQVDFLSCTCYKQLEDKWSDKLYFSACLSKWVSIIAGYRIRHLVGSLSQELLDEILRSKLTLSQNHENCFPYILRFHWELLFKSENLLYGMVSPNNLILQSLKKSLS